MVLLGILLAVWMGREVGRGEEGFKGGEVEVEEEEEESAAEGSWKRRDNDGFGCREWAGDAGVKAKWSAASLPSLTDAAGCLSPPLPPRLTGLLSRRRGRPPLPPSLSQAC